MSSRDSRRTSVAGEPNPVTAESPGGATRREDRARDAAANLCQGFVEHDRRNGGACREAFAAVDRAQFPHLTDAAASRAGGAYAAALWEKDAVEAGHVEGDTVVDRDGLAAADWSRVRGWLERRADVVGMDRAYASETTTAWKRHKVGGDYWTPTMAAQRIELTAAVGDGGYPSKPRFGTDGFGHLATRYLTGVELHDMRSDTHWEAAVSEMTTYFAELFARQERDR
jgi:hypothetical protein